MWVLNYFVLHLDQVHLVSNHSDKCSELINHLCNNQYYNINNKQSFVVIDFLDRTKINGVNPFGDIGQMMLTFMLLPVVSIYVEKRNLKLLRSLLNGVGLYENTKDNLDIRVKYELSLKLAESLRKNVINHEIFTLDDNINTNEYTLLTFNEVSSVIQFIHNQITPESLLFLYHPDVLFCVMSILCPKLPCSKEFYEHTFDNNKPTLTHNTFNLLNYTEPIYEPCIHSQKYNNISDYHRKQDEITMIMSANVGGLKFNELSMAQTIVNNVLNKINNENIPLMTNALCEGKNMHNTLFLPLWTHSGEVIDPVIMSLIIQTHKEECNKKISRARPLCPLIKKTPETVEEYKPQNLKRYSVQSPIYNCSAQNSDNDSDSDYSVMDLGRPTKLQRVTSPISSLM